MTVDIERVYEVDASVEDVWEVLADPALRAKAISVVDRFEVHGDEVHWYLDLPIPGLGTALKVRTRDLEREPPRYVKFVGESRVMTVQGEHELTPEEGGCRVRNQFVVDGHLPGVERFFKRRLDSEIERMLTGISGEFTAVRIE